MTLHKTTNSQVRSHVIYNKAVSVRNDAQGHDHSQGQKYNQGHDLT